MDELDLLKQHWKKDDNFPQINKEEIRHMLHKSSSSIVKWIFIICCLELLIGLSFNLFFPSKPEESVVKNIFEWITTIISYGLSVYFIYTFFTLFKKIKNSDNTKTHLESIVAVRLNAERYIRYNLLLITVIIILESFYNIIDGNSKYFVDFPSSHPSTYWGVLIFAIVVMAILATLIILLFRFLMKLYYRLVYGILLKKLNKNYEELIELDKE